MRDVFFGVLQTVILAVLGYLGVHFSKIVDKYFNSKEKKEVVKTAVRFVEQVYSAYDGAYKKEKAVEYVTQTLAEAGIPITELELNGLIEAAVKKFNDSGWKAKVGIEAEELLDGKFDNEEENKVQ